MIIFITVAGLYLHDPSRATHPGDLSGRHDLICNILFFFENRKPSIIFTVYLQYRLYENEAVKFYLIHSGRNIL